MTAQTILNDSAIATTAIFLLAFLADFTAVLLQAWRSASPAVPTFQQTPTPAPEPQPVPQPVYASLNWVQPQSVQEIAEEIDVIALAKATFYLPPTQCLF